MKWSFKPCYNVIRGGIKFPRTVHKLVLDARHWNVRVRVAKIGSHGCIQVRTH